VHFLERILHLQKNGYRACIDAVVKPRFIEFDGCVSLINSIVSLNLHRRHLSESQRAMVAAKIATMKRGDNQHASIEATSQTEAAELLNVSRSAVQRASTVLVASAFRPFPPGFSP